MTNACGGRVFKSSFGRQCSAIAQKVFLIPRHSHLYTALRRQHFKPFVQQFGIRSSVVKLVC